MHRGIAVLVAHPSSELYGSDRVLLESVTALVAAGCAVTVALPSRGPLVERITATGAEVALCPSPVIRKSITSKRGMVTFLRDTAVGTVRGARLIREKHPDVVYVNTLTVPLWVILGRLSGRRVILHIHEAESTAPRLIRALLSAPSLLAHRVLVNSSFSGTTMTKSLPALTRRGLLRKTDLLQNGIEGPAEPQLPRANLFGPFHILYVGRLSQRKGVDLLLEAVASLNSRGIESRLRIVGAVFTGYEWYEQVLHERADAPDLRGLVDFVGFTDDVWSSYAMADVAIVPSRKDEPFGNTAVEALLALRPVVVSNTTGLKEAANNYHSARFFTPDSAEDLADQLADLHASWTSVRGHLAEDRIEAIRRHSPERYRAEVTAATLDRARASDSA